MLTIQKFNEYIPFTNYLKGNQAKSCLIKGWNHIDCKEARETIADCPSDTWIQRRLRVRDENDNYVYSGLIIVDVDDPTWADKVLERVMKEDIKCQARKTKHGYHFIFRIVPSRLNAATNDYLNALELSELSEATHMKTAFVSDPVVDFKFTEIVRHIVDVKGGYVGRVSERFDRVIDRDISYDNQYSGEELSARNSAEELPDWYPAFDDIPEWLIPLKDFTGSKIPESIMFYHEIEEMISMSDTYIFDQKNINIPHFLRCINNVFDYRLVENSNQERDLFIYSNGYYQLVADDIFIGIIDSILSFQEIGETKNCSDITRSIFSQFKRHTNLKYICSDSEFDTDESIVNFKNGILNLETGELLPHSPKYLSSIQIPCNWDTNKDSPEPTVFINYLKRLTAGLQDQEQIISMILQYCGCCLTNVPVCRTKGALIFQGKSNAGKSQIFNMMFDLIGRQFSIPIDLQNLSSNRFATAALYRKRLTGHADLQHSAIIRSADIFRQITTGDIIYGEAKYRDSFSFIYKGGLIYCCNSTPNFGDQDEALYNRLYIVPCENEIPTSERDPDLLNKFRKEYPQIIKLMLREFLKLKKNNWHLYVGGTVAKSRKEYEDKSDNVKDFCELSITQQSKAGYQTVQFWYDAYVSYCKLYDSKGTILKKYAFMKRFEEITGCQRNRVNYHRCYEIYPTVEAFKLRDKLVN